MPDTPLLSIVIVNFNGLRFLDDCLESISRWVQQPHEVIIVDNASSDGSVDHLRRRHPTVRLLASETNTGFTGGNNLGATLARGEYILLLNNDTLMRSGLDPAFAALADGLDLVGCRMFYGDGRQQPSCGFAHTPLRLLLSWLGLAANLALPDIVRRVRMDESFYASERADVDWVSGAFMLMRKTVWDTLQGFDTRYFMYLEDVDLCERLRRNGGRVGYVGTVSITHFEGSGRAWLGRRALVNSMHSYMKYTIKFHGRAAAVALRMGLAPILGVRALVYGAMALLGHGDIWRDKATGYAAAAATLACGRPVGL